MVNFQIMYDKNEDRLIILKPNSRNLVDRIEGKYGVEACHDIEGSVFGLIIPEPSILFGLDDDVLDNFVDN